jgi:hypothetical protein
MNPMRAMIVIDGSSLFVLVPVHRRFSGGALAARRGKSDISGGSGQHPFPGNFVPQVQSLHSL